MSAHRRNLLLATGLILTISVPTAYFLAQYEAKRAIIHANTWLKREHHEVASKS